MEYEAHGGGCCGYAHVYGFDHLHQHSKMKGS